MPVLLFCFALLISISGSIAADPLITSGPVIGRVTPEKAHVWCRVDAADRKVEGILFDSNGNELSRLVQTSSADADYTVEFVFEKGIRPGETFRYRIDVDG
ncbi:MAG: hypothetical protein ACPG1Z_12345, partial [Planctomycetota bacterium]